MLIAALTIFLLGGGSDSLWLFPQDFAKQVKNVVTEEKRQTEILTAYDEIQKNADSYNDEIRKMVEEISKLNQTPAATETDYEQPIQSLLQKRKQIQTEIIDTRLKMASQFSQDEWEKVFSEDSTTEDK
jgi:predicted  nucleic acid-binding Zn-ribbon protein